MNDPKPIRVLVAEDDFLIGEEIVRVLKKLGYDAVGTAANGRKAVEMTGALHPDVVLMDLKMPVLDGISATRQIQAACPTPVVILTAHESRDLVKEAGEAGALAYLTKPPREDEIGRAIAIAMARHEDFMALHRLNRDLNHQKEALHKSETWLQSIFNSLEEGVFVVTPDRKIANMNNAAQRMFGYAREELLNRAPDFLHMDQAHYEEFGRRINEAFDKGRVANFQFEIRRKNGEIFPSEHTVTPLKSPTGEPMGIVSVVRDITERKKTEEALLKARKLESMGILAGGIAHDYNNLLSMIMGNLSLAREDAKPEYGISEFLESAEDAAGRAAELTRQMLHLSKGGGFLAKRTAAIGGVIEKTAAKASAGSGVTCDFSIPNDLWQVEFDEDQMKQVIGNVVTNGVEAMPKEETIAIKAENVILREDSQNPDLPLAAGKYIKISIQDQGMGIPPEHLPKIFDPYFSTKKMGVQKGMGLGLATALAIVKRHGGHIGVTSRVGVGTTLRIFLPASEEKVRQPISAAGTPPMDPQPSETKRILIMDDEEMLRNLGKEMLTRLGYAVETAGDGAEAIRLYRTARESGEPFDAVILDLTIKGGMGGKEAIRELQTINPEVKAILYSGYSEDPIMTHFREYGFCAAMAKPYQLKDLADNLTKILGKERK